MYSLCGVGLVVHEEKVQVAGVVDEEGLVAGRHHVAGLLVAAVADLYAECPSASVSSCTVTLLISEASLFPSSNPTTHPPLAYE